MDRDEGTARCCHAHLYVEDVSQPRLSNDETLYALYVARLKDGDTVVVTDAAGTFRHCRLTSGGLRPIERPRWAGPKGRRAICLGVSEGVPLDWAVAKATELGISELRLCFLDNSPEPWESSRRESALRRLALLALAVGVHSGHYWAATVGISLGLVEAVRDLEEPCLLSDVGATPPSRCATVCVPPASGWSERELELVDGRVSLGLPLLPPETASIAVAALMMVPPPFGMIDFASGTSPDAVQ